MKFKRALLSDLFYRCYVGNLSRFFAKTLWRAQTLHQLVTRCEDFGEADEYVFYAMEFLSGGSLADEVARRGRLDYKSVLKLGHEMAGAHAVSAALKSP